MPNIKDLRLGETGFTLVELMISIAIIAVLSAVALSSVSAIQKSGRDTQRQADLRAVQSALQQFYADNNYYPNTVTLNGIAALNNCTGTSPCPQGVTKTYLSVTPKDPISGTTTPYCYTSYQSSASGAASCATGNAGTCHFYKLHAKLEGNTGNVTCGSSSVAGYNFEVTPL